MFQMRRKANDRAGQTRHVGIEPLESRRLMSGSILGPSAVEGKWKGDVTESSGSVVEARIVVTATKAELIIGSDETLTASLTSAHFKAIREGTFDVKFIVGKDYVTVTGKVKDAGLKISGDYTLSTGASGTFLVKKYSTVG